MTFIESNLYLVGVNFSSITPLGPVYFCYLLLLEALFMLSKAEVMLCSHSTLMADNAVECKKSPSPSG